MANEQQINAVLTTVGNAALTWRALAEQIERDRNQAFADLAAATARADALEADLAGVAELLLREQARSAALAVEVEQMRAALERSAAFWRPVADDMEHGILSVDSVRFLAQDYLSAIQPILAQPAGEHGAEILAAADEGAQLAEWQWQEYHKDRCYSAYDRSWRCSGTDCQYPRPKWLADYRRAIAADRGAGSGEAGK